MQITLRRMTDMGSVHAYDAPRETLTLRDGGTADTLRVDVSLCVSPFRTYPWLEERNTVVVAMGYVEEARGDEVCRILRAWGRTGVVLMLGHTFGGWWRGREGDYY